MLIPTLNALENVELPALLRGESSAESRNGAKALLEQLGLGKRLDHLPTQLSGGEQQRLAIARAVVNRPSILLADEPIASLDPESARKVTEIPADLNRCDGKMVVGTLHQVDYAVRYCQRAVALKGGRIHFDGPTESFNPDFLNDLYGGDLDISLLLPQGQRPRDVERPLTLAKA